MSHHDSDTVPRPLDGKRVSEKVEGSSALVKTVRARISYDVAAFFAPHVARKPSVQAPTDRSSYLIGQGVSVPAKGGVSADARPAGYSLKRAADIVASALALGFFAPLLIFVGLLVWLLDPGPVFFSQERVGFGGRRFRILKFRTMYANADDLLAQLLAKDAVRNAQWAACQKLAHDPRITPLGRILRVSSIDELPQLFNVLRGDMSLVGPRPIVPKEIVRYGRYFDQYCAVRPGLTGLWQVSGRNHTTYRRRVAMDVTYSRKVSLGLDLWILLKTLPAVFSGEGCY